jgi:hypothetical protein
MLWDRFSFFIINENMQGYLCNRTCWNAVPEVLSQKDARHNSIPELFFFPGIGVTTPHLSDQILDHSLGSGTSFKRKTALKNVFTYKR